MTTAPTTAHTLAWLHMRLTVPADWEPVRHSVNPARGQLALVDRTTQRLLLDWSTCATPPDGARLWQDYRALDQSRHAACTFDPLPAGGAWAGYRCHAPTETLTRAGRHAPELQRWIELTLAWPRGHDAALEASILHAFACSPEPRVCAFGFNVTPPADWTLAAATIHAGDGQLRFARGRGDVRIRRLSLPEAWYHGDAQAFIRKELADTPVRFTTANHRGHAACCGESREARNQLDSWHRRRRTRQDVVWVCPTEQALYHLVALTPASDAASATTILATFNVHCCAPPLPAPAPAATRAPFPVHPLAPPGGERAGVRGPAKSPVHPLAPLGGERAGVRGPTESSIHPLAPLGGERAGVRGPTESSRLRPAEVRTSNFCGSLLDILRFLPSTRLRAKHQNCAPTPPPSSPAPPFSGSDLLTAIPTPNQSVRAAVAHDGALVLHVPLRRHWFMRRPVAWLLPFSRERSVALDTVGREVWQACDGRRTVEQIVDAFAARHRLTFHAARLSVMQFLRDLTRRGLIVMAVTEP